MQNLEGIGRAQNLAGQRRKAIEKALKEQVRRWLDGRPGDLCMGDIYQEFFKGNEK